ncbi:unnamed protein product [Arctogadus glacialis]
MAFKPPNPEKDKLITAKPGLYTNIGSWLYRLATEEQVLDGGRSRGEEEEAPQGAQAALNLSEEFLRVRYH